MPGRRRRARHRRGRPWESEAAVRAAGLLPLSELEPGTEATVDRVAGRGRLRRRLLEMGFTEGAHVRVAREAPLRDPVDYEIRGYHVSLRRSEASLVWVRREG